MKSKTSCFNLTIWKKNLVRYWPLWVGYLGYLLLILPIYMWVRMSGQSVYYMNYAQEELAYSVLLSGIRIGMKVLPIFGASCIMAMAVFSYLYSARQANMIHSLPFYRLELFVTNYISGILFLLVPQVIAFLMSVLVCTAYQITHIQYLFQMFLYMVGMTFFSYSMAVFVAMFTGQLLAMPVYYLVVNLLYVGGLNTVFSLVELVCYGVEDYHTLSASYVLSPLYYLTENVQVHYSYDQVSESPIGIEISGGRAIGIYAIVAVVLIFLAYQLYKRRQIECAGEMISIGIIKPIFRWGVALCGGIGVSVAITDILSDYGNQRVFFWLVALILILGTLCFFGAQMLLQKSFRVFQKRRILEWAAFAAVAISLVGLFEMDVFGLERKIPAAEEVELAYVYMDFPMGIEEERLPQLLEIHQMVLDEEENYLEHMQDGEDYYYTTFTYYLKDGSTLIRRYPLSIQEKDIADSSSPAGRILAWEQEEKNLSRYLLGWDYENNIYYSGEISLYSDNGQSKNYYLDGKELEAVLTAIQEDIREGNFAPYSIYSRYQDMQGYENRICMDYLNRDGIYGVWDYYEGYRGDTEITEQKKATTGTIYVYFGPECTNIERTLRELGIVNDTWKLMTYEEYQQTIN
ncbi:MAG: ABC transporter permease [Clostridiales bacterium]|nr:ABC transporter permease [Clostridiales bacterium]